MPSVALTLDQKVESRKKKTQTLIREKIRERYVTQQECGSFLGITQQAFSHRLNEMNFTYEQMLMLFDFLKLENTEIERTFKLG